MGDCLHAGDVLKQVEAKFCEQAVGQLTPMKVSDGLNQPQAFRPAEIHVNSLPCSRPGEHPLNAWRRATGE